MMPTPATPVINLFLSLVNIDIAIRIPLCFLFATVVQTTTVNISAAFIIGSSDCVSEINTGTQFVGKCVCLQCQFQTVSITDLVIKVAL